MRQLESKSIGNIIIKKLSKKYSFKTYQYNLTSITCSNMYWWLILFQIKITFKLFKFRVQLIYENRMKILKRKKNWK